MLLLFVVCLIHIWLSAYFRVRTTVILSHNTRAFTPSQIHTQAQKGMHALCTNTSFYTYPSLIIKKSLLFKARVLYSKSSFHLNLLLLLHLWSVGVCLSSKYQDPQIKYHKSRHTVSLWGAQSGTDLEITLTSVTDSQKILTNNMCGYDVYVKTSQRFCVFI